LSLFSECADITIMGSTLITRPIIIIQCIDHSPDAGTFVLSICYSVVLLSGKINFVG
jgi:hypothetical protein